MKSKARKLLRAIGLGGIVCVGTVIAPLGATAVVTLTAATAATSWIFDSIGDKMKKP